MKNTSIPFFIFISIFLTTSTYAAEKPSDPKPQPCTVRELKVGEDIFYKINNQLIWDRRTDASRMTDTYVLETAIPQAISKGEKKVRHLQRDGKPTGENYTIYYYPSATNVLCELRDYGSMYFFVMQTAHENLPAEVKHAFQNMPRDGQLLTDVLDNKRACTAQPLFDAYNQLKKEKSSTPMISSFNNRHVLKNYVETRIVLDERWNKPLRVGDDYMLTVVAPKAEAGKITFGPRDEWVKYEKRYRSKQNPTHKKVFTVVRDVDEVVIYAHSLGKANPIALLNAEHEYSAMHEDDKKLHNLTKYSSEYIDGSKQLIATLRVTPGFYKWFKNDGAKKV